MSDDDKLTLQQRREIFWAMKKKEALEKRNYPKRIRDFQPVEGVMYRVSPTTGMQRPVRPHYETIIYNTDPPIRKRRLANAR